MDFAEKIEKALAAAKTVDDVQFIEDYVQHNENRPNYRTKAGREIRDELLDQCDERRQELEKITEPF